MHDTCPDFLLFLINILFIYFANKRQATKAEHRELATPKINPHRTMFATFKITLLNLV